jgi:hypothetical protein
MDHETKTVDNNTDELEKRCPTAKPENMTRDEYLAIRKVLSGQLFGDTFIPTPAS